MAIPQAEAPRLETWRIDPGPLASRPKCLIQGNYGRTQAQSIKNLTPQVDGTWRRRQGLAIKARFKTAGGVTFNGSRNGYFVSGQLAASTTILYNVSIGASAAVAWVSGLSLLMTTADTGTTWTSQSTASKFYNLDFVSDTVGFACGQGVGGTNLPFYSTPDGGVTWNAVGALPLGLWPTKISFFNSTVGIAVGRGVYWFPYAQSKSIAYTLDGGITWAQAGPAPGVPLFYGCWMASATVGYAVGYGSATTGVIYKTVDGGATWILQATVSLGAGVYFTAVHGASATAVWAVSSGGHIYATTDGSTWAAQTSGVTTALYGVWAASASIVYAVGASGVIRKTTDGGTTWGALVSGTTQNLFDCEFSSTTAGWAVGGAGTILVTADGTAWASQTTAPGPYNKWCIGGSDSNVYEVPEGDTDEAVEKLAGAVNIARRMIFATNSTVGVAGVFGETPYVSINPTTAAYSAIAHAGKIRWWLQRYSQAGYAIAGMGGTYAIAALVLTCSEIIGVGGADKNIHALGKLSNEAVIILKEDGSLWGQAGEGGSSLRMLAANLGQVIPYATQSTPSGVVALFYPNVYLCTGGNPINLTKAFEKTANGLFSDMDLSDVWIHGSGYNAGLNQYFLTYLTTSATWRTFVYDFDREAWFEFVNALFTEGSFYDKNRSFYLSLKANGATPPGLYLLDGYGSDPDTGIAMEYWTGDIYKPGQPEVMRKIRSVRVFGTGWTTCTIYYRQEDGTWGNTGAITLSGAGPIKIANPTGGTVYGSRFQIKFNGTVTTGDGDFEGFEIDLYAERRGPNG